MATTGGQGKTGGEADPPRDILPSVIVMEIGTKKKKRRGSSRSSRRLIDIEYRVSKSLNRVTKAVNSGVETYLDKRDKSERRRKDGAIVDSYENAAVGMAEAVAKSAPVLSDIAEMINTRYRRKQIRRLIRSLPVIR